MRMHYRLGYDRAVPSVNLVLMVTYKIVRAFVPAPVAAAVCLAGQEDPARFRWHSRRV